MKNVRKNINSNIVEFEKKFNALFEEKNQILKHVLRFIVKSKGKQMRPMFVLLCAKINGAINDQTIRTACMIELLHTATLVHDDVVDESLKRRSFFSINAIWKNKIAVLVGDYLLAKGLLLSIENEDFELLKITSNAVKEMSLGELLQIEKARKLDITEDIYFEIIRAKTASLLASACSAGAYSTTGNKIIAENFRVFGENVGIAFQIKDDLLDYGIYDTGKPKGIDIKEKKMTLPIIYTLSIVPNELKRKIIYTIKNHNTDKTKVSEIMTIVENYGGIDYAQKAMERYKNAALEILNTFPKSEARQDLATLVDYVIERKK